MKKIVIIDDEESLRHMLSVLLKTEGYDTVAFPDASKAVEYLETNGEADFIICDIKMPGMTGLEFLKALRDRRIENTVVMMSAYGSVDTAIECMKMGAYDYVSKPFKTDEIILTIKKAEERERLKRENSRLREECSRDYDFRNIITRDSRMASILDLIRKISDYTSSVLITGESGTGKELVARAIHFGGSRAQRPFVAVNCGAIPAPLLESELFGHVRGAFTDAHRNKTGLFQEADGGTLFLDEVGEMPMELQVKLLRALQESEIRRVGDTRPIRINTRVVAATIRDLKEEIKKGRFREDLYYRLNVIEITLPPLKERPGDIEKLARHFVEKFSARFAKSVKDISPDALAVLQRYNWPGNVRELENVMERAMILEETGVIRLNSLPMVLCAQENKNTLPEGLLSIKRAHEIIEKELIKKALEKTGNNRTRAAALLEISHRALLYKIKSYGL